ncbi:MAG: hypothetical protein QXT26_00950 [Thermoproteota archaeon]
MITMRLKEIDSLNRIYEEALRSISMDKDVKAGGALLTFPDKERNLCELSATFIVKKGRFSKEQRVIVVLPFKKDNDGVYVADVDDSVFHVVEDDKGSLKEVWNGRLKEAMDKLGNIAKVHIDVISTISKTVS